MDIFSGVTKSVGDLIAKVKNNNTLIDDLNKKYNPTFIEIVEELKEDENNTLLALLYDWYRKRNKLDFTQVERSIKDTEKRIKDEKEESKILPNKRRRWVNDGGCGGGHWETIDIDKEEYSYGSNCGYGNSYKKSYSLSGGC